MKTVIVAFTLAMTTAASALDPLSPQLNIGRPLMPNNEWQQQPAALNPLQLRNDRTGEIVGTVTVARNHLYVRNLKGELIGTVVVNGDKRTFYDPKGKIVDSLPIPFSGVPAKAPD